MPGKNEINDEDYCTAIKHLWLCCLSNIKMEIEGIMSENELVTLRLFLTEKVLRNESTLSTAKSLTQRSRILLQLKPHDLTVQQHLAVEYLYRNARVYRNSNGRMEDILTLEES